MISTIGFFFLFFGLLSKLFIDVWIWVIVCNEIKYSQSPLCRLCMRVLYLFSPLAPWTDATCFTLMWYKVLYTC